MDDLLRVLLVGANTIAAQAIWRINVLAAETAFCLGAFQRDQAAAAAGEVVGARAGAGREHGANRGRILKNKP